MGQKFILSEQEKLRIKSLYENAIPPDEFEVVGYINPFREKKYFPYVHVNYSPSLKDGDLFYDLQNIDYFSYSMEKYTKCIKDFLKPISSELSDLIGKTVRTGDDSIQKISEIIVRLGELVGALHPSTKLILTSLKDSDDIIPYKIYVLDENQKRVENQNLNDVIRKRLPQITAKDLPDCLFELKKVKRIQTDFKP